MNILIDAHVFDEAHQGTRTYLKGLYGEMILLIPSANFFFAAYNTEKLEAEFGNHSNVKYIQLKWSRYMRLLFEFPILIREHRIDFAHFQYVSPPIKNCKHVVTLHDILFRDHKGLFPLKYRVLNDLLFRVSAKRADILVTVSEYSRKRIALHYGIPVERIHITPNGVSADLSSLVEFDGKNLLETKYNLTKFILYVSRVEPRKNHIQLLKAFKELGLWRENYSLVFIGRRDFGWEEMDAFIAACEPGCRQRIVQLNRVDDAELVIFYKAAKLFIYPSLAEGFGIPPLEALALGTATLCSKATAMSDFDFLGDDLFDPSDLDELKRKMMDRLLGVDDPQRRSGLQRLVATRYTWRNSAEVLKSCIISG